MKLVIFPAVDDERFLRIQQAVYAAEIINAADTAEAQRQIVDADAFFGKLTPQLLAAATRLRWVQAPTASLEHYIFPQLVEHSCELTNMRGLFSDVVADHAFGFIICLARNFPRYLRQQATATWEPAGGEAARSDFVSGPGTVSAIDRAHRHLADCTLGVVGLGGIGRELAIRAAAFGMRVVAVDPRADECPPAVSQVWSLDGLPQLLAESDFVVVAAPHTAATERLFRRPQFEQMQRTAYLINVGRGAIVDLEDLTAALRDGQIAGAGLDVLQTEPLPADHPLWRMENVIITPHVAGCSPRIAERHLAVVISNLQRFAQGQPLLNVVRKDLWY